jgi:predicted transcriptional regulator
MTSNDTPHFAEHAPSSHENLGNIAVIRVADVIGERIEIFALRPGDTVESAAQKLARWHVRTAAVCDDVGNLAGIFGQSDISARVVAAGLDPKSTIVQDVMTSDPISADIETDMLTCVRLMRRHGISHIALTRTTAEGEQYFGLVSANDILGVVAKQVVGSDWMREFAGEAAV